jgi:hypothetical protein
MAIKQNIRSILGDAMDTEKAIEFIERSYMAIHGNPMPKGYADGKDLLEEARSLCRHRVCMAAFGDTFAPHRIMAEFGEIFPEEEGDA